MINKAEVISYSISVIVFVYNEYRTLEIVVNNLYKKLNELNFDNYEIIIIDDGSNDGSEKIASKLEMKLPNVRVIHHYKNMGLGEVYKTGFDNAKNDLITFYPADGQFPATNLIKFIPYINEFEAIFGYLPNRKSSFLSKLLSKIERIIYEILFGKLPKFQGLFMIRRYLLNEINLKHNGRGWALVMELIIKINKGNYKIISIPTEVHPRKYGHSKVNNIPVILANFKQVISLYIHLQNEKNNETF